jgi:hypothetical protein
VTPGAASLHLVDGVSLLRPEEQVFSAMLTGFANQQLARNLARSTVEGRENTVRAFANYVNAFPWQWSRAMVDEWLGDLRSLRDLKTWRPRRGPRWYGWPSSFRLIRMLSGPTGVERRRARSIFGWRRSIWDGGRQRRWS